MPARARRLSVIAAASALVAASGVVGSAPAMADDSPAPVAVADTYTVEARSSEIGGVTMIDVLANDTSPSGGALEICRVQAPERGLSVAEVSADGDFSIDTPHSGIGHSNAGATIDDGAREQLVVLSWGNRAGTYQFTYWACDTEHLTPGTVTVTVTESPELTVRRSDRPGRLRFANPRSSGVLFIYGGLDEERPDGRVRLAAGTHATRSVEHRVIRWLAFAPRTGEIIDDGVVRGIRLPGAGRTNGRATDRSGPGLTAAMLRAWRR